MDVICVNDVFPPQVVEYYNKYGITKPVKDKMYTVRTVVHHTTNETGITLEEIVNPKAPNNHPVLGMVMSEPTFHINRFSTLSGLPLKKEEIEVENFV